LFLLHFVFKYYTIKRDILQTRRCSNAMHLLRSSFHSSIKYTHSDQTVDEDKGPQRHAHNNTGLAHGKLWEAESVFADKHLFWTIWCWCKLAVNNRRNSLQTQTTSWNTISDLF